ncbi:hypothetical protein [Rhizobium sp. NPDC092017]|uniref:hypothetical protein n=1 Tax=Rhizobium sp. NPDC092017 TaxID=3364502 RepID=UPI00380AC025
MDEKKKVRERRSISNSERQEALENTPESARKTIEDERRKRNEKTERLKQARLARAPKDRNEK